MPYSYISAPVMVTHCHRCAAAMMAGGNHSAGCSGLGCVWPVSSVLGMPHLVHKLLSMCENSCETVGTSECIVS